MSSATSDRQDVDSVSDPVSAETCEEGEAEPSNRDTMRLRLDMGKGQNKKLDGLSETAEKETTRGGVWFETRGHQT